MWAERHGPSAPAWGLILALHMAVLALWNTRLRLPETRQAWSELRLIPARPMDAADAAPRPAPRAMPEPSSPPSLPTSSANVAPPAPPEPLSPDLEPPAFADTPPPAVTVPAHDAPLRLTLPADAASRPLALNDPRGNTPISRFGARIAHDLGDDGRWVEERMDADFVRLRRGNTCINLHRNSGAARQPFNESTSPTLWGATPSYRCERR